MTIAVPRASAKLMPAKTGEDTGPDFCWTKHLEESEKHGWSGDVSCASKEVKQTFYKAKGTGEISHFQALTTAVSGTVGIGNIGGVAIVITIGGA